MSTSHLGSMPGEKAESGSALALDARFSTGKAAWALGAALTANERRVFASCERTIQRGRDAFMEVADALQVVRDGKLYREKYGTFAEYCEKKWQITARYARSICAAADDVKLLREEVGDQKSEVILPRTESQARPLSRLESDKDKVEAWAEVAEEYKDAPEKITAKAVSEAVERRMPAEGKRSEVGDQKSDDAAEILDFIERGQAATRAVDQLTAKSAEKTKWPQPSDNGVFSEVGSSQWQFNAFSGKVWAQLRVLQIGEGQWISAWSYQYKMGDLSASISNLRGDDVGNDVFPTREKAIFAAAREGRKQAAEHLKRCEFKTQRPAIRKVIEWANKMSALARAGENFAAGDSDSEPAARMETKSKVLPKGIGEGSPSGRGSVSSAGGVGVSAPAPLGQRSEVGGQRSEPHAKDAKGAKKGPEHFRIARGKSGLWHIKEAPGWSVLMAMESLVSAEKFLSDICRDPSAVQVTDSGSWETVGYWNSRFSEPGKEAEVRDQRAETHAKDAKGAKKGRRVSRAEQVRAALDAAEPMVRSLGALLKGSPEEARYNVIMSHLDAIGRKWRGK